MKHKVNIQRSRFYCSNLFAIVLTTEGEHVKDCRKKSDYDTFILTHNGKFIVIDKDGLTRLTSNTILNIFSLN